MLLLAKLRVKRLRADDVQRDQGRHVQQEYPDLVECHARIVNRIKGLDRDAKPATMQLIQGVMTKDKRGKPDRQKAVVDGQ